MELTGWLIACSGATQPLQSRKNKISRCFHAKTQGKCFCMERQPVPRQSSSFPMWAEFLHGFLVIDRKRERASVAIGFLGITILSCTSHKESWLWSTRRMQERLDKALDCNPISLTGWTNSYVCRTHPQQDEHCDLECNTTTFSLTCGKKVGCSGMEEWNRRSKFHAAPFMHAIPFESPFKCA